ncbi:hypothetical protein MTO96_031975 [Rhipicephalus appendiculatus]
MFTNRDIRGVERTGCMSSGCDCDAFTRPSALDTCGVQSASVQCGWCCYCGHSPVNHRRALPIEAEQEENGIIQIECTPIISEVQTLSPGNVSTFGSEDMTGTGEENGVMVEAAQCLVKVEQDSMHQSNSELETESMPQHEPEPESQPEPILETSRKRRRESEDDTTCSCGLKEKVEQLERDKKRILTQMQYLWYNPGPTGGTEAKRTKDATTGAEQHEAASEHNYSEELATLKEVLSTQIQNIEDMEMQLEKKDRKVERLRRQRNEAKQMIELGQIIDDAKTTACTLASAAIIAPVNKIDIGYGVLVDKVVLERIRLTTSHNPMKFARSLVRAIFTPEELLNSSLNGISHTDPVPKKALDPRRVDAVVFYTCKLFKVDVRSVRISLASLLREAKYMTTMTT